MMVSARCANSIAVVIELGSLNATPSDSKMKALRPVSWFIKLCEEFLIAL
jgi:hypothetical protein